MTFKSFKSFKSFVEAFDNPYKWKKTKTDNYGMTFMTKLDDGRKLKVRFDEDFTEVEIIFLVDEKSSLTGGGDAFRIFATVKEIIEKNIDYLEEFDVVFFAAKTSEQSRVKLYKILSKWIKKKLKRDLSIENDSGDIVYKFPEDDYYD